MAASPLARVMTDLLMSWYARGFPRTLDGHMSGAETFIAPADAYDRLVGRYGPQLGAALLAFAGVEPGMTALDVGCGPGALTHELAARLGAGNVSAVDPSEPFAAACRARNPGVHVAVAPAEELPFGDASFDFVLSQLVVNFMSDAHAR